jgi:hypothetical protein
MAQFPGWSTQLMVDIGAASSVDEARNMTEEDIRQLFREPDDAKVNLRFYWQYLECVDYDRAFYNALVKMKNSDSWAQQAASTKAKTAATRALNRANRDLEVEGSDDEVSDDEE